MQAAGRKTSQLTRPLGPTLITAENAQGALNAENHRGF